MRIDDIIRQQNKSISFEFFPPKNQAAEDKIAEAVKTVGLLNPTFVSVTYGAGGGTRTNTAHLVKRIKAETSLTVMSHLTCIGQSREELRNILADYQAMGIENVLALRGDPPQGVMPEPGQTGYCHGKDVVELAASFGAFCIGAACYPEGHVESEDLEMDLFYTKQKIDAGAHFAITQMFFDNCFFYQFVERADKAGIRIPIIPGIMPILDVVRISQFCQTCGATQPPPSLVERMQKAPKEDAGKIGVEFAMEQCADLIKNGIRYFHFYTLNQPDLVTRIYQGLKLGAL